MLNNVHSEIKRRNNEFDQQKTFKDKYNVGD